VGLHQRVDIAGSLVNDRGLAVAQVAFGRIVVRVAVGPMDLDRHRSGGLAADGRLQFREARGTVDELCYSA